VWVNQATGEVRPGRCRANFCEYCGPVNARVWQRAIVDYGRPERMIRLSQFPENFSQTRSQVRDLRRRLVKQGYACEWAWVCERNPRGTGYHGHLMQHGDYIPQAQLQDMTGGRIPYVEKLRGGSSGAGYALKGAGGSRYMLKGAGGSEALREHLELNGGRIVHYSRGFFRSQSGDTLTGTEARKAVVKDFLASREQEGSWVRVPVDPSVLVNAGL
jgi:hypothetical protein